jgi:predicted nucleic acid-binding protein
LKIERIDFNDGGILETSALFKLFVPEIGSNWLQNNVIGQTIVISELALFESANILRRRYTEGNFTREQAIDLFGRINRATVNYTVIPLGTEIQLNQLFDLIFNLPNHLRIRTLDSIHLVSAQTAREATNNLVPPEPFIFMSSDKQLLLVAQAQGFSVENPENHP